MPVGAVLRCALLISLGAPYRVCAWCMPKLQPEYLFNLEATSYTSGREIVAATIVSASGSAANTVGGPMAQYRHLSPY
jgi:hypothetical protein